MDKLFLIDAYAIIYRAYYAFIRQPRVNSKGFNTSAVMGFCNTLHDVISHEKPTHMAVAFDPRGGSFRSEIFADYKAQREETPEVIRQSVPIIKDILTAMRIKVLEVKGFEADDVIGTLANNARQWQIDTYMLTPDKDYGQLVGGCVKMYRPRFGGGYETLDEKGICDKYGITAPSQMIDLLGLMGDTADNIPGCPGVGEKTAVRLIAQFGSVENMLANSGEISGKLQQRIETNGDVIKLSKQLATIRTDVPVDIDLEAMRLTDPDTEALQRLMDELEFKTLAAKMIGKSASTAKTEPQRKIDNAQLDLFSLPITDYDNIVAATTVAATTESVCTEEAMRQLCARLMTATAIAIDTKTTAGDAIAAQLLTIDFAADSNKVYSVALPATEAEAQQTINIFKPLLESAAVEKIGCNMKRSIEALAAYGVQLQGLLFDTAIAQYLLQPEQHNDTNITAVEMFIAREPLEKKLSSAGLIDLFWNIEMPLVRVLAEMEMNGVRIDTASLADTSQQLTERMAEIEETIYSLAGQRFNIASPRQVGDILFDKMRITDKARKTRNGQYSTSEEVLQQLRGKHEIVGHILTYRALKKLLGTYVDALPKLINPKTGHIHTSFNQTVTATGRLSSSEPNLQNIPVRGEDGKDIRKAFIPDEGCLFFSADYSQIELRIMAHLSGDDAMLQAFNEGKDIHTATAANVYKTTIDKVTPEQRTKAKRANFGIIYGITAFGLAERLDITRTEASDLIEGYFATFPKVWDYMEQAKQSARTAGYATTFLGRRRYLPDILSKNGTVRGFAERNAVNAPIQGSAADVIKIAMIRILRRFKEEGLRSKMILQVHDELNFSVLPDEREMVERIVVEEMEHAYPLQVPLTVDCGWGDNWLEAH